MLEVGILHEIYRLLYIYTIIPALEIDGLKLVIVSETRGKSGFLTLLLDCPLFQISPMQPMDKIGAVT